MNIRRLILALAGALVISICCTALLGRKIAEHNGSHGPKLRYLVAARIIAVGEILKAEDMTFTDWPASQAMPAAFAKIEDVSGRATVFPMDKGQLILNQYLAAPGASIGLTTKIPEGMRAITLKSDEVVGVAGFIFPGSRVDVLVTYRPAQGPDPVTSTVLQNAPVVAVGHQTQPDPNGKTTPVDAVTILANPQDSEKVVLASTQGSIHFVLRNGNDHAATPNVTVRLAELGTAPEQKTSVRPQGAFAKTKTKPYVVETILGDKQSVETFN